MGIEPLPVYFYLLRSKGARIGCWLTVLLAGLSPAVFALDPDRPVTAYRHEVWQEDQGLLHSTINSVLQARNGYLWLATFYGLVRFDGVRFTVFDTVNTPAIQANRVRALAEDRDGTIWLATAKGLSQLRDGAFSMFPLGDRFAGDQILTIAAGNGGEMWFATTAAGLCRIKDGRIEILGLAGRNIRTIHVTARGMIWIGSNEGLHKYEGGRFQEKSYDELLTAGSDGAPRLYKMHREKKREIGDDSNKIRQYQPLLGRIWSAKFDSDGKRFAAAASLDGKGEVAIYDTEAEKKAFVCEKVSGPAFAVAWNKDGSKLASGGLDGKVWIHDPATGKLLGEFEAKPK